jgi:chromosomal replication initiator protein
MKTTPTKEEVLQVVCDYFEIEAEELIKKSRKQNLVYKRQVLAYLCYFFCRCSYEDLGEFIGNRDHATMLYSVSKISTLRTVYEDIEKEVKFLESKVKQIQALINDDKLSIPITVNLLYLSQKYTELHL